MGRKCSVMGCNSEVGLYSFPKSVQVKRHWLRVLGLGENCELPVRAGVCKQHFTSHSFSNFMEVQMGFAKTLMLKSEAIPTLALPILCQKPPTLCPKPVPQHQEHVILQIEPKATEAITDPVISQHKNVQVNMEPCSQSEAIPARAPSCSMPSNTETLKKVPPAESPRAAAPPLKRKWSEMSATEPSSPNETSSFINSRSTEVPPHKDRKYIVHEGQLLGLFQTCPVCAGPCSVDTMTVGTLLRVTQQCTRCEYSYEWSSQPMVNSIPSGNLQLCAAVLFTGSSFHQISKFLQAFNVQGLSEQYFNRLQAKLLIPTVSWQWKLEQEEVIKDMIADDAVTLGGGMQTVSPGHSGSYTTMDLKTNKVIDIQLVQSNEVENSVCMEEEGLRRSLSLLEEKGVKVQTMVTDRHSGVQKYLREKKKDIEHYFDSWHIGKELGKKMEELAKRKVTRDVGPWKQRVVNHLHWSASTSSSGQDTLAKWTSVANHIQNVHTHENALFPQSQHEPLVGQEARPWLKPSTAACERLTSILLAPRFLKDVEKISPLYNTSNLEDFHSLIRFSRKSEALSFRRMLSRLQIAALHYNENATRSHSVTATGEQRYCVVYPKYKRGKYTVRAVKEKTTSVYLDKLMTLLFESVVEDAIPSQ